METNDVKMELEEVYALTADLGGCAWFQLDPQGRVQTWNSGAERIFGYQAKEVLGHQFSLFYQYEDVARGTPEQNLAAAVTKGCWETEGWRVRKGGDRFWGRTAITTVRDYQGIVRGFAKVTRNLTDRHQAVTEERERVASEHGIGVVHELFGLSLQMQALASRAPDQQTSDAIGEIIRSLDAVANRLRNHLAGPVSSSTPGAPSSA